MEIQFFKINQIFNSFNEFKELLDTFSIEWGYLITRYGLYMRCNQSGNPPSNLLKERKRSSIKCNCNWVIKFQYINKEKEIR